MKRIIWHLPFGMIGGAETLYATILKYLDGFENYVTCHESIKPWCETKFENVASWTDAKSLARQIGSIEPDLIIGTHGRVLYQALEGLDIPVIEIVHGSHVWSEHNANIPKTWTKHIVCVSNSAERTVKHLGIPTSVIINGVDTEIFKPEHDLKKEPHTIGYIGRFMESDKHITKIVDAMKSIPNARLNLIGGNEIELLTIRNHARRARVQDRVRMLGHTSTPEQHYKHIDVFTVRSEAEGYCNSAAEAMACGVPLVCFNFGGIIEHAPTGAIAVANNQLEYIALLQKVFNDYDLRSRMREIGLEFIHHEGNASVMAEKYKSTILDVLKIPRTVPQKEKIKCGIKKKIVGVCNPTWTGIATATRGICERVISPKKLPSATVCEILLAQPDALLLSGWCPGFREIALAVHSKGIPVYAYYHGGPSHFSFRNGIFGKEEQMAFAEILELSKQRVIKKIAVSSPGFDAVLRACGFYADFCGNIAESSRKVAGIPLEGIHIGNWNRHHDHKHTTIGIAASQLIEGSKVHCLDGNSWVPGLMNDVVSHKEMSQFQMYEWYSKMTVNLQMSFIETFNISVMEMWACGRPVVLGPGNQVLTANSDLNNHVMCYDHTNPEEVARVIYHCIKRQDHIIKLQFEQLEKLNLESKKRWAQFFE